MAIEKKKAILAGAKLLPGGLRLLFWRWLILVAVSLPGVLMANGAVSEGIARSPYYTDIQGRLPLVHLQRLFSELPPTLLVMFGALAVIGLILNQALSAGALVFFQRGGRQDDGPSDGSNRTLSALSVLLHDGLPFFWSFLRIVLVAIGAGLLGVFALGKLFEALTLKGEVAGWSGLTLTLQLPLLQAVLCAVWIWLVGAWAHGVKVITVLDGRRRIRRTAFVALRFCWRHPLRWVLFFAVVTFVGTASGASALFGWRQSVPRLATSFALWGGLAILLSFLRSTIWYWVHHAGVRLYDGGEKTGDLRGATDAPFGWWSLILRWLPLAKKPL